MTTTSHTASARANGTKHTGTAETGGTDSGSRDAGQHSPMPATPGDPAPGSRLRSLLTGSQPRWVRPSAALLLAFSAVLYLWNLEATGYANSFYAAAVQAGTAWSRSTEGRW